MHSRFCPTGDPPLLLRFYAVVTQHTQRVLSVSNLRLCTLSSLLFLSKQVTANRFTPFLCSINRRVFGWKPIQQIKLAMPATTIHFE